MGDRIRGGIKRGPRPAADKECRPGRVPRPAPHRAQRRNGRSRYTRSSTSDQGRENLLVQPTVAANHDSAAVLHVLPPRC